MLCLAMPRLGMLRIAVLCIAVPCIAVLASCGGGDPATPTQPAAVVVSAAPGGTVVSGATVQLSATYTDTRGRAVPGTVFSWSSSSPNVATVTSSGLVTGGTVGSTTITAAASGSGGVGAASGTTTITITPGAPTRLVVVTQPSGAASGARLTTQPVIEVRDNADNVVTTSTLTIAASILGTGVLGGTVQVAAAAGVARFTDLALTGGVGGRALLFSGTGVAAATSSTFALVAGPPAALLFERDVPLTADLGAALSPPPIVRLIDNAGNVAAVAGVSVRAAATQGAVTLRNDIVNTDSAGRATFTGLSAVGVAATSTLQFTSAGLPTLVSRAITLSPPDSIGTPTFITVSNTAADTNEKVVVLSTPTATVLPALSARNAQQQPMANAGVQWLVRDASRATVGTDGRITGLQGGRTWVVAQATRNPQVADSLLVFIPRSATGPLVRTQLPTYRITTDTFSIIVQVESRDGRPLTAADLEIAWPGSQSAPFSPLAVSSFTSLRSGVTFTQPDGRQVVRVAWATTTPVSGPVQLLRLNCRVNQRGVGNQVVITLNQLLTGDLTDVTTLASVFNPVIIVP